MRRRCPPLSWPARPIDVLPEWLLPGRRPARLVLTQLVFARLVFLGIAIGIWIFDARGGLA